MAGTTGPALRETMTILPPRDGYHAVIEAGEKIKTLFTTVTSAAKLA